MTDNASLPPTKGPVPMGATLLTAGGIAAAFGLASCCALPFFLAGLGIGTAWLGEVGLLAAPHRIPIMILSAVLLTGGAVLLWRQQRAAATCAEGKCAPPLLRLLTLVGLLIGACLLWAGYTYA